MCMMKPYHINLLLTALVILSVCSSSATSSALSDQEVDAVIEALLCPPNYEAADLPCRSDFTIWAKLLAASKKKHINLPAKAATMFVPSDSAISHLRDATDVDPYLILSHVTPNHLFFSDLYQLKPLSLLPTLVPSKTILITSTLPSSYKVDNAVITQPDIYVSSQLVVHGIDRILDLNPRRSSLPPLLHAGNVLTPMISPAASPVAV